MQDQRTSNPKWLNRGRELGLAIGLVAVLLVILIPLPPALMDAFLIFNITTSLLILMTTTCIRTPLEFSAFPSLLLIVTFFRLALNIGTTRLILGNGEAGTAAAGGVVEAFGTFVAGSNLVVGIIVFAMIMVVQFLVITKGTTRISEVAARFTLDALPGKQMSIDSDLAAGLIDEKTARQSRDETRREADFYGAMDGASKFVRGEALAGVVIALVNILAGFFIGAVYHGMEIEAAAEVFTRLTIGDGLVSQIPALMVSVATALVVTKSAGSGDLGPDMARQLLADDRLLFGSALFLLFLIPSGLPVFVVLGGSALCAWLGFRVRRRREAEELDDIPGDSAEDGDMFAGADRETDETSEAVGKESDVDSVRQLLPVPPIELQLGLRLIGLADTVRDGRLLSQLGTLREDIALELGFVVPAVAVRDNLRLHPAEYSVRLRDISLGTWRLNPNHYLAIGDLPGGTDIEKVLSGRPGIDPVTQATGVWVDAGQRSRAQDLGLQIYSACDVIVRHLNDILRSHAAEILTREEVARMVDELRSRAPHLISELIPGVLRLGDVHKVLQNLLREQVSVRDLENVLEVLADQEDKAGDATALTERVRRAFSRRLCAAVATDGRKVRAVFLEPALEDFLQSSLEGSGDEARLAIEPEVADALMENIQLELERHDVGGTALVCAGTLRPVLFRMLAPRFWRARVLSYEEINVGYSLSLCGSVALKSVGGAV